MQINHLGTRMSFVAVAGEPNSHGGENFFKLRYAK